MLRYTFVHTCQVNYGRQCTNLTNMVVDMLGGLIAGVKTHKDGDRYTAKLEAMQYTDMYSTPSKEIGAIIFRYDFSHYRCFAGLFQG